MDLALDQMVGSMRRQDVAAAMRANEYRRIALERRATDTASTAGARSPWTRLTRAFAPRGARRFGSSLAEPGRL